MIETEDAVEIHRSRLKLAGLAIAPAYFGGLGVHRLLAGEAPSVFLIGLVLIGFGTAAWLVWSAIDRSPAIVIDRRGITIDWPKIGLIPWRAVAGMALSKAPIVRGVLLIALDEQAAGPDVMARARPHFVSGMSMNSAVARFRAQVRDQPIVQVKIAMLDAPRADLQRVLEERVRVNEAQ